MLLLPRRPARHHPLRRPERASPQRARDDGGAGRLRARSRAGHLVQPRPGAGPPGADLDPELRRPAGLAQPNDPVQGEIRQEQGQLERRALRLPHPPGRRHPALSAHPRARGRRPAPAYRAVPRHRDQVQHGLWPRSVPGAGAADRSDRRPGDEPSRRQGQDVQIGPFGHEPDQPHRRYAISSPRRSARRRRTRSPCPRRWPGWRIAPRR